MDTKYIAQAEAALAKQDPILGALIATQTLEPREPRADYFDALCRAIIGQQVSVAAAAAIFKRFADATNLDPQAVLQLTETDTKAIGLSRQKTSYITDLARHFVENPDIYNHLDTQSDEAVITELTAVKGIGTWTAQMFLMFTLNRPDVFAPDDGGLQRAMLRLYGWSTLPPKAELATHAEAWKPYRTVASLHLWHSLNNTPK